MEGRKIFDRSWRSILKKTLQKKKRKKIKRNFFQEFYLKDQKKKKIKCWKKSNSLKIKNLIKINRLTVESDFKILLYKI